MRMDFMKSEISQFSFSEKCDQALIDQNHFQGLNTHSDESCHYNSQNYSGTVPQQNISFESSASSSQGNLLYLS